MAQFDVRALTPIVQHGTREFRMGAPLEHVLREVALIGALMGTGMNAQQAMQYVEQRERQLLGMPAQGEAWEPWHGRAPRQPQPRPQPRPPVTRPGVPYGYPGPGMGAPSGGTYPPMMGSWQ